MQAGGSFVSSYYQQDSGCKDDQSSCLSGCLVQLVQNKLLITHSLFSMIETRVSTLWLKRPNCFFFSVRAYTFG